MGMFGMLSRESLKPDCGKMNAKRGHGRSFSPTDLLAPKGYLRDPNDSSQPSSPRPQHSLQSWARVRYGLPCGAVLAGFLRRHGVGCSFGSWWREFRSAIGMADGTMHVDS